MKPATMETPMIKTHAAAAVVWRAAVMGSYAKTLSWVLRAMSNAMTVTTSWAMAAIHNVSERSVATVD